MIPLDDARPKKLQQVINTVAVSTMQSRKRGQIKGMKKIMNTMEPLAL
jgi:hypothetical protein